MPDIEAISRIGDLLPAEHRERYLRIMAGLKEFPEEDELLLVIEALAFTMLMIREVPEKMKEVIAASAAPDSKFGRASTEYLMTRLTGVIKDNVHLPSFEDFKRIHEDLSTTQHSLNEDIRNLSREMGSAPRSKPLKLRVTGILAIVASLTLCFSVATYFYFERSYTAQVKHLEKTTSEADELAALVAGIPGGKLHVEPVGFVITQAAADAYMEDENRAVVYFKPRYQ